MKLIQQKLIFFCMVCPFFAAAFLTKSVAYAAHVEYKLLQNADTDFYYRSFDSVKIHYRDIGNGYPVLLLHGFIVDGSSWKSTPVYSDLLAAGYRLLVPDLRGNGKSDKPHADSAYANDAESKDMIWLMNRLGIEHYAIIGYSRGSIITARLLSLDSRVDRAVIGGMGADFCNPEWPRRLMFYHALIGDSVKELEPMLNHIRQAGLDRFALACLQKEQPSSSRAELRAIRKPVITICGKEDADNGSSLELTQLIPGAIHADVPGDHGSALRSKEFASVVIRFLKK